MEPPARLEHLEGVNTLTSDLQLGASAPPLTWPATPSELTSRDPSPTFSEFYEHHRASVFAALTATLGDPDLAADATDEAMTRAYARWGQVSHFANPSGWVYRVGLNWARGLLRRHRLHRAKRHLLATEDATNPAVRDPELAAALASLSLEHRAVVVLRHLLDWSVEQTADALDIPEGTVKSRLSRALDQLASALDAGHPGSEGA